MAYNIVKGKAGSVVGKDVDQEVGGNKKFVNPLSAHGFYDTHKDSEVATLNDLAISKMTGNKYGGILTFTGKGHVRVNKKVHFTSDTLHAPNVIVGKIAGSGFGLTDLPVNNFAAPIPAESLDYGNGLRDVNGAIQVKPSAGIQTSKKGVSIDLANNGGLSFTGNKLVVDARRVPSITQGAQNLHDQDVMLVQDSSRGDIRNTTLANLYEGYLKTKVPHAEGGKYNVQFRGNTGFAASPNFCFEPTSNILAVNGQINTNTMLVLGDIQVEGATRMQGSVVANVTTITSQTYEVHDDDYTILADTTKNTILVTLPPAENHAGRIFNIKKINSNPYKLNSNKLTIKAAGGKIDSAKEIVMKMNNSCRVFKSDGRTWWNIGSRGS